MDAKQLTMKQFQLLCAKRTREAFPECADWDEREWLLALAGEAGEACDAFKKFRRGDYDLRTARVAVLKEVADVVTYAAQLCTILHADLAEVVSSKFNEVSARRGWQEGAGDDSLG